MSSFQWTVLQSIDSQWGDPNWKVSGGENKNRQWIKRFNLARIADDSFLMGIVEPEEHEHRSASNQHIGAAGSAGQNY